MSRGEVENTHLGKRYRGPTRDRFTSIQLLSLGHYSLCQFPYRGLDLIYRPAWSLSAHNNV